MATAEIKTHTTSCRASSARAAGTAFLRAAGARTTHLQLNHHQLVDSPGTRLQETIGAGVEQLRERRGGGASAAESSRTTWPAWRQVIEQHLVHVATAKIRVHTTSCRAWSARAAGMALQRARRRASATRGSRGM